MKKNYQTNDASAMGLAVPEAVTVVMAELAGEVQEGLLAMAVGTGLQVMAAMMHADVAVVCGPKGKHDRHHGFCRVVLAGSALVAAGGSALLDH